MEPQYGVGPCPCQMRAWIAAQERQHTPSLKKPDTLLSDKYVAISNIAGYCDKILYACSPQDNRSVEAERQGSGAADSGSEARADTFAVACTPLILIEAPSSAYHRGML